MNIEPSNSINPGGLNQAVIPALRRASAATGVDFNFLLEQARTESSLNPKAQARTSSARGLFQFLDATWLELVEKHGARHGLQAQATAISRRADGSPTVKDPAQRDAILALRDDPYLSGVMAAELAQENAASLRQQLGREAKPAELYMAHFLGAAGAARFLGGLEENPDIEASYIVPAAARANQAVFFKAGKALSLDQVYARFEGKFGPTAAVPAQAVAAARPPAADPRMTAAALAAHAARLAAVDTLQMGNEPDMPTTGASGELHASTAQALALAAMRRPPALQQDLSGRGALIAMQVLQALTLPGEEETRDELRWRV
jgi:hypothetical protein